MLQTGTRRVLRDIEYKPSLLIITVCTPVRNGIFAVVVFSFIWVYNFLSCARITSKKERYYMKIKKMIGMLILALLLFVLPFCAIAENLTIYYNGLNYDINTETKQAVVGQNRSATGNITIPATIKYDGETYSVTEVGIAAFSSSSIKSVKIEDGVSLIGYSAFSSCSALESVDIPDSIVDIAQYAFNSCRALKCIKFPANLTKINSSSFSSSGLTTLTIPSHIEIVDDQAFGHCKNLKEIIIEDGVKKIGRNTFTSCNALTSITIPSSVTEISESAFHSCTSLKSVHILNGTAIIGNYVFYDAQQIEKVTMPGSKTLNELFANNPIKEVTIAEGTTKITANAFLDCTTIEKVTLPESLKTIGTSAFDGCTALKEITIPASVERISLCAFASSGLTDAYCEGKLAPVLDSTVGIFPRNTVIHAPEGGQEYTLENGWRNVSMPTPPVVATPTPTPVSVETPTPKPTVNTMATPAPTAEPTASPTIDPDTVVILDEMPETGDDSSIGLWLFALIACGSVLVWMRRRAA